MFLVSTSFDRDGLALCSLMFYLRHVYADEHHNYRSETPSSVILAVALSEIYTAPMLIENGGSFELNKTEHCLPVSG